MTLILLALAAGALTVLAPCILPVLPIILGGTQGSSRWRPVWVVIGFVVSFSLIGAALATVGNFAGIMPDTLRTIAAVLLVVLGLLLLFPKLYQLMQLPLERLLASRGQKIAQAGSRHGLVGGLFVGLAMGLVWTPCAGPVLGSILTLAATTKDALTTTLLLSAYSIGAALPMLLVAYAGRGLVLWLRTHGRTVSFLNRIFGLLLILAALAIATGFDRQLQTILLPYLPSFILL